MKYFVYIIESVKTHKYYVGSTDNVRNRITKHNKGGSKYTKGKGPWLVEYTEVFETLSEARKKERQIKSWKKRKAIERLFTNGPVV